MRATAANARSLSRKNPATHRSAGSVTTRATHPRTQAIAPSMAPTASCYALSDFSSHHHRSGVRLVASALPSPPSGSGGSDKTKPRLAFFVSGGGSNFKAIHAKMLDGEIDAEVAAVVTDVPGCGGEAYAVSHAIPTLTYPIPKKGGFPGLTKEELVASLVELNVDYVILAGYLKLIPAELVKAFPRKMLNIHPGLLPAFGGKGMFTGPTVHFVDEEFDTGPILAQRVVPVYPTDSYPHVAARVLKQVAARVLKQEHQVYPEAVSALVDGRITWRDDGIPIMWSAH
eukprot:gene32104-16617_t